MPKDEKSDLGIRVRLVSDVDRPRLIALVNAAFAIETFLEGTRTDAECLKAMMDKGEVLVAEDAEGELAACVYTEARGARGYLGMLAVAPARQCSGLGRLMIAAGEEHLLRRGCEAVDITVLSLRPELPPIYRRLGYVETGTEPFSRPCALKPGAECHGIVMSKKL